MRRPSLEQRLDQLPVRMEQLELKVGDRSVTYGVLAPKAPPPAEGYPLIVALHYGTTQEPGLSPYFGLGYVGQLVLPALQDLDAVIVAPDAPEASWAHRASEDAVLAIVAQVRKDLSIDARRTLVTGFSMGGQGAWFFAATHPELFTAAIPMTAMPLTTRVSTRADVQAAIASVETGTEWTAPLLATPLYVIHSRADQTVPVAPLERAVRVLEAKGGKVTLVLIDDIAHNMIPGFIDPLAGAMPWIRQAWNAAARPL
jgi:predicted peptidase